MAFALNTPYYLNPAKISGGLTNFPLLFNFVDARYKTVANGGNMQSANGYDIRPFSDSALTSALTFQLERYNGSTGEVIMRVLLPTTSIPVFYMGCGDATITTDGSSTTTWNSAFLGVYQFKDGTTLSVADSTGLNNGTNHGATAAAGQIDGCASLVSASVQYVDLSNVNNPAAMTLSAWVKATSFPSANGYNAVVDRTSSTLTTGLWIKNTGKLACYAQATSSVNYDGTGASTLVAGTWYHLAVTYDSVNGLKGYVNGVLDGSVAANGALVTTATNMRIGSDSFTASREWNGLLDDVQISNVARSQAWIQTEYNQGLSPSTALLLTTPFVANLKVVPSVNSLGQTVLLPNEVVFGRHFLPEIIPGYNTAYIGGF